MDLRLNDVSDDRVLERVRWLVGRSNEVTAELLAYLIEVEERGLHLREATSSLFAFCVERLHLSESAAAKRIWAARTARRFPLARQMIARGEIHLTGLNLLAPHLTEENHAALLARAVHRTRREIEAIVAELAPKPDVPSRVAKVVRPTESAPLLAPATTAGPVSQLRCRPHNQTMEWRSCRAQSSAIRRRRYRWIGAGSRGNALPGRGEGVGLSHSTIRARWRSSGVRRRCRIRTTKVGAGNPGAPQLVVRDHRRWTAVTLKREGRRWRQ